MKILGIESSCDETASSVVSFDGENYKVLSNIVNSQIDLHKKYGGVVPEVASRAHIENIEYVVDEALKDNEDIDAVAVTATPGLLGALLVGVNYAKGFAYSRELPLIAVNHIEGHISSLLLEHKFNEPIIVLVASGGHCLVYKVDSNFSSFELLAKSRDDAPGEAFDKIARLLDLGYPGGPVIEKLASEYDGEDIYKFPQVKIQNTDDFSFSGVKTAVINAVHKAEQKGDDIDKKAVCFSFQEAVANVLAERTVSIALKQNVHNIAIVGGVSANSYIKNKMQELAEQNNLNFYSPDKKHSGDNAAMIAVRGIKMYQEKKVADLSLDAVASLKLKG